MGRNGFSWPSLQTTSERGSPQVERQQRLGKGTKYGRLKTEREDVNEASQFWLSTNRKTHLPTTVQNMFGRHAVRFPLPCDSSVGVETVWSTQT
jgi:hypothetical protein